MILSRQIHTAEPLIPELIAFEFDMAIVKPKSPHVSVSGNLHSSQCSRESPHHCSGESAH